MDLLERSIFGLIIQTFLWPTIFLPVDLHHSRPYFTWGLAIGLAGLSFLRFGHKLATGCLYFRSPRLWIGTFVFLSSTQASLWGAVFAISIADPQLGSISVLIMLTVGAVSSSTMNALTPRLWLAVINTCLILVPSIVVSIVIRNYYSMALLLAIYLLYLILFGRKAHAEYTRAFDIEYELESQRQELERINKIDSLTMIYNRGHFNTAFEVQWNAGIRNQQEQSLLMIDIDHFKSINDNYGHLFGDKCLREISNTIHTIAKRKTDLIARFGGEEFAILLSNTSLSNACKIAEDIRNQIQSQQLCFKGTEIRVTASIGVSCLIPQSGIDPNRLIGLADKAMYRAKDEGRNCVRHTGNLQKIKQKIANDKT